MNMLIYCENGNLTIRKPNRLEWSYQNTDRPNLGFDYDVLVYDDIEVKIMKWEEGVPFENQTKITLTDDEVDAIEQYIENSAPPEGVNLNNQYSEELVKLVNDYVNRQIQSYGFTSDVEVVAAGREGSNHPLRSDARRVLEYYDAIWNVYLNIMNEVKETREDLLKDFEFYANQLPNPQQSLIG